MAAPEALKPVEAVGGGGGAGRTGHSKQHNSFFTLFQLPLVNYMQVFSFLKFFFLLSRSNKNVTIST